LLFFLKKNCEFEKLLNWKMQNRKKLSKKNKKSVYQNMLSFSSKAA